MSSTDHGSGRRSPSRQPRRSVRTVVFGVDFTSAPRRAKPITVAVGWLMAAAEPVYRVETVRGLESLAAFEEFLREPGPWLAGFDLPFGQSRSLIAHEGWPDTWTGFVAFFCNTPREQLRDTFRRWCNARPSGDKFAWRRADKPAGSSPAMRWANPPVAWMMHAGIGRMLEAGLVFPAHAHPSPAACGLAASGDARIALEAYPGFTARHVCRGSYKSDVVAMQSPERQANRRAIIDALIAGTAGLTPRLEVSTHWRRKLIADGSGDLVDAVICGLQAAHASLLPGYGLPDDVDPLEGWIASVPSPDRVSGDARKPMPGQIPLRSRPARPVATTPRQKRSARPRRDPPPTPPQKARYNR